MGLFYGGFACVSPFLTDWLMETRGQTLKEANGNAGLIMMVSGFALLESVVELRGCGVSFSQMNVPMTLCIFMPALIVRLCAGVLTQQQKVGGQFESVLPASWSGEDAHAAQRLAVRASEAFCVDSAFFTTILGTSIGQHILNACTFVMLAKGKESGAKDVLKYLVGGTAGTPTGGVLQMLRTVFLRVVFCATWNWFSSQKVERYSSFEAALLELDTEKAEEKPL
jgi:hypothetical protein